MKVNPTVVISNKKKKPKDQNIKKKENRKQASVHPSTTISAPAASKAVQVRAVISLATPGNVGCN